MLVAALNTHTSCFGDLTSTAQICTQCILTYTNHIFDKALILVPDDHIYSLNTQEDVKYLTKAHDDLVGCMARTGGPRTVTFKFLANPWAQLVVWCRLAEAYSVLSATLVLLQQSS